MIIVFDMDDTLYDEMTFVKSGFRAVAQYMNATFGAEEAACYQLMLKELKENGRGRIFNRVLEEYGTLNKKHLKKSITTYRLHTPEITLNEDALRCFERFEAHPLYVVTDGHKLVQDSKVRALGLYERVKKVFITYRYGRHHSKPSPYCFERIAALESAQPSDIVYIGDNPHKDFVGIKPLGFKTIRIHTGGFKDDQVAPAYDAHLNIHSLDELTPELLQKL
jgi:putative hydrolase of the HAD superfamily